MAGDLNKGKAFGGRDCPTGGGIRLGVGLSGVVDDFEGGRCDCEWECECEDLGVGLVAVFVTMMAGNSPLFVRDEKTPRGMLWADGWFYFVSIVDIDGYRIGGTRGQMGTGTQYRSRGCL